MPNRYYVEYPSGAISYTDHGGTRSFLPVEDNADYQEYLAWKAKGGKPTIYEPPAQPDVAVVAVSVSPEERPVSLTPPETVVSSSLPPETRTTLLAQAQAAFTVADLKTVLTSLLKELA